MLLGNDGEEGASVRTAAEAGRLAATTRGHAEALQAKFGLAPGRHDAPAPAGVNEEFRGQLRPIIDRYLDIQSALAADDLPKAAAAAEKDVAALSAVDMSLVSGQAHMDWMKSQGELSPLLTRLAAAKNIEAARKEFALASEALAALLTRFGVPGGKLYKAWCPMAFDNRGASWIQGQEEINNPYFGEMMLRCGEVREVVGGR